MSTLGIRDALKQWNSNDWCLGFILFFSIVYLPIVPIGFIIWTLTFWRKIKRKNYSFWKSLEFLFIVYYLLLVIGMGWTQNLDVGLFKLENKFSFLLFPILFYFSNFTVRRSAILNIILFSSCFSLLIYEIIAVFKSIYYPENNHWGYFKDVLFSPFMHRGYYAFYLVLASLICHAKVYYINKPKFYTLLFIFISFGVLQTLSKAGILSWLLLNIILFASTMIRKKKLKTMLLFAGVLTFSLFLFLNLNSSIKERFEKIPLSSQDIKLKHNNSKESNQVRILMWNASLVSINKSPFLGYGTGDDITILEIQNAIDDNQNIATLRLNSHNQFFTTTLQVGVFGLFILIGIFFKSWWDFFRGKQLISLLISFCFFCNFLVESFLERQAGIVLFCVLLISLSQKNTSDKQVITVENKI